MASKPPDRRGLLRHEGSDLSEASTVIASPPPEPSSIFQRHGYHKMGSQDLTDPSPRYQSPNLETGAQGLGISHAPTRLIGSIGSIARRPVPVATKASPSPPTPTNPFFATSPEIRTPNTPASAASSRAPLSPPWQRYETQYNRGEGLRAVSEVDEESINKGKHTSAFREDLLSTPDDFNTDDNSFRGISINDDNDNDNERHSMLRPLSARQD